MKKHVLNEHSTKDEKKKEFKYYCENCCSKQEAEKRLVFDFSCYLRI